MFGNGKWKSVQSGDRYKAAWKDSIHGTEFEFNSLGTALPGPGDLQGFASTAVPAAIGREMHTELYSDRYNHHLHCLTRNYNSGWSVFSWVFLLPRLKMQALGSRRAAQRPLGGDVPPGSGAAGGLRAPLGHGIRSCWSQAGQSLGGFRSRNTSKCVLHNSRVELFKRVGNIPQKSFFSFFFGSELPVKAFNAFSRAWRLMKQQLWGGKERRVLKDSG